MLPVRLDGGDKILPKEHRLALDEIFDQICAARIDRAERKDKERRNAI